MKIPTIDTFQVKPGGGGLPVVQGPNAEAFDAAYQQSRQMARAVTGGVEAYQQIAMEEQKHANSMSVLEAENRTRELAIKLTYDKETGYDNLKGGNVRNLPGGKSLTDTYTEKYQQGIDEIAGGLANSAQRDAYHESASQLRVQFAARASAHEAQEYNVWENSVADGITDLASQTMALNPNNIAVIDENIERIIDGIALKARNVGASGNELEALQRKSVGAALTGTIQAAIDAKDSITANSLMERYGNRLTGDNLHAIKGALDTLNEGKMVEGSIAAADGALFGADEGTGPPGQQIEHTSPTGGKTGTPAPAIPTGPPGKAISYTSPAPKGSTTVPGGEYGAPRAGRPDGHLAKDYAAKRGTPVPAPGDALVLDASFHEGGGNTVKLRLDDGSIHTFMHLDDLKVRTGGRITAGTVLGGVGNTGSKSHGFHLHYEVEVNKKRMDPDAYRPGPRLASPGTVTTAAGGTPSSAPTRKPTTLDEYVAIGMNTPEARAADPSQKNRIRSNLENQYRQHKASEEEGYQQRKEALADWLFKHKGKSIYDAPSGLIAGIKPTDLDSFNSFSHNLSVPGPRDQKNDDRLYNFAFDPANRENMRLARNDQFLKTFAGHPQFNAISNYRNELRSGKRDTTEGTINTEAMNRALTSRLTTMKIDPSPKDDNGKARIGSLQQYVTNEIIAEQQRIHRQMNDAEVTKFIDTLFLKTARFQGANFQPRLGVKYTDISTKDREIIEKELRDRGRPVNEDTVTQWFYAQQR